MIGDYFSKMATAQNMPPQVLNKSVQNGVITPNMASDAMSGQARSAPAQGIQALQAPPIAQQVLQEADQLTAPEKLAREIEHVRGNIQKVQEGVQTGAIEAYKGIPFLKEQIDTLRGLEQQLQLITNPQQAMPQMPPQQMAQAPQGIDAAPSNLPAEGYAGGGIVAFADNRNQPVSADMPSDPMGTGAGEIMQSAEAPYGRSFMQWLTNEPDWKAKAAAERAKVAPVVTAPAPESKKDTGIFIHDTKPRIAGPAAAPAPRTDLGIPLVYGPPEEDGIAKFEKKKDANYEELKKAILGDPAERDKQLQIQTLLKIMGRGFEAAGGTSPYAMANIGPAAAKGVGDIAELYAQQEAAKEKRVGQLVALGLKGQELDAELVKLGITKKYYDMHAPLLAAQAAEAQAKIPLYGAQAEYYRKRPLAGATAGMPKGIPANVSDKVLETYQGYEIQPTMAPFYKQDLKLQTPDGRVLTWTDQDRQYLKEAQGTPSGRTALDKWNQIVKVKRNERLSELYNLGGRTTAGSVYGAED